ncbi:disks large homolog 1-like [Clytia hemisphaerica]|uniref:disks large homolog 1-like n=1 Tax=Clytia hemisphaerica TaxID=252671 RepID=UPI0034D61F7E
MSLTRKDCKQVLVLLEDYNNKISNSDDDELKQSFQKIINVLKSQYFGALLDIQEYYEEILKDAHESPEQVEREAQALANKWKINSSDC